MAKYLAFPLTLILSIAGSQGAWAAPNASIDSSSVKIAQVNGLVDIQNHWARPFIQGLAASNLVSSSPNSQFRPNQGVTRAEFAAILELSYTILPKVRSTVSFKDVPPTHWAATAIQKAYQAGFMAGDDAGTFHPDRLMTRAQAMVSIANGLEIITNPSFAVLSLQRC
jgi:S-layer homology domain